MGDHLYITDNVVQPSNKRGFKCLTCHLPSGWVYGYPGWTYRQYFKFSHFGGFRWSTDLTNKKLLVLATDQSQMERINISVHEDFGHPVDGVQKSIIYQPFQTKRTTRLRVPKLSVLLFDRPHSEMFNLSWDILTQTVRRFIPANHVDDQNR
ncbi:hypothetical protein FBUS_01591 [Fasciolopsis buskii]|uniref:Uncharacterized protein n=1 Tax=Fasciolopsis buskii TaxID=27845 RepID=A0A8E0RQF2_9TREM|nr:hypothetical protein FBUS_01591 [Fasciolopsis buski]